LGKKVERLKGKWLSEQEVWSLLTAADHPRDKALLGVTWEGGFRIGESLGLTIGNCKRKSYGFDVTVSGKTGTRTMQIVVTAPLLEMWLYNHPDKDNKQAPVFLRLKDGFYGSRHKPIGLTAADQLIKKIARRVGLKKDVSIHWLRHTQCTFYADNGVSDEEMRKIFGWKPGSKMPSRYTHLSGSHTRRTVLTLRGVTSEKVEPKSTLMQPKKCLRCGDREKAQKIVEKEKKKDQVWRLLMEPGVVERLQKVLEKEGIKIE